MTFKSDQEIGVTMLKLLGFTNITDEDIHPYRAGYQDAIEKVKKLNDNSIERSKAMESSSTMDAEATELMEIASEDIYIYIYIMLKVQNRKHPLLKLARETSYYHSEN